MSTYYYKRDVRDVSDPFKLAAANAFSFGTSDTETYDGVHYVDWTYSHEILRRMSIPEDVITSVEDGTTVPVAYLQRRAQPGPHHSVPFMVYAWRLQEDRTRRWWYWTANDGEPLAPWLTTEDPGAAPAPDPTMVVLNYDWDTDGTDYEGQGILVELPGPTTMWSQRALETMAAWPGACVGGRMEAIAEVHNYGDDSAGAFIQYVLTNHESCFEDYVRAMGGEVTVTNLGPGETRRGDEILYDSYSGWVVVYDSEWGTRRRVEAIDDAHLSTIYGDEYIVVFDPRDGELRADARSEFQAVS